MQRPMTNQDWQQLGIHHVQMTAMAEACSADPHGPACIERRQAAEASWREFAAPESWPAFLLRKIRSI